MSLYFFTIINLKFSQIFYRLLYFFKKNIETDVMVTGFNYRSSVYAKCNVGASFDGESFNVFGDSVDLMSEWNPENLPKLWVYNLHYHDFLNREDTEDSLGFGELVIDNWIRNNPVGEGNGWEPYCLSIRIVNWIKWINRQDPALVKQSWLDSLGVQGDYLSQSIEYHILGNHIFENAKALIFLGVYLDCDQSDKFLKLGLGILSRQLPEQFLNDGANFELSPMYHSIMLWSICDLVVLCRSSDCKDLKRIIEPLINTVQFGLKWLKSMIHPDRGLAFFNDSTFGVAPSYDDLVSYCNMLAIKEYSVCTKNKLDIELLKYSGFAVFDWPEDHRLIADIGIVGPSYQPGHAHADTLSCELSLFGQRLLVNSGISVYGQSKERQRQRSTSAHNTVVVDSENSSEVWAGFRVARRAKPYDISFERRDGEIVLESKHDGYRRLRGNAIHHRKWLAKNTSLTIIDQLSGSFSNAFVHWHFHPDIVLEELGDCVFQISLPQGAIINLYIQGAKAQVATSTWHPGFGKSINNQKLLLEFCDRTVSTKIEWSYT